MQSHDKFCETYKIWITKIAGDIRLAARGHDFIDLLSWAVNEFKGLKDLAKQEIIERLLVARASSSSTLAMELQ
jgi:hypothetical protein